MTLNEANLFYQDQRLWHCNTGLVGSKQEKPVLLMPDGVYWEAVRGFAGGRLEPGVAGGELGGHGGSRLGDPPLGVSKASSEIPGLGCGLALAR